MWRSDRRYKNCIVVFYNIKNFVTIDETDFSGNIHGMKYHFIRTLKNPAFEMIGTEDNRLWILGEDETR